MPAGQAGLDTVVVGVPATGVGVVVGLGDVVVVVVGGDGETGHVPSGFAGCPFGHNCVFPV